MKHNIIFIWKNITSQLNKINNSIAESLNSGATEMEISVLDELNLPIPKTFKDSLCLHNGQKRDAIDGFLLGGRLLSVAEIIEAYNFQREIEISLPQYQENDECRGIGPVKPALTNNNWLPFIELNGDVVWYLDFDPLATGHSGQIIRVDIANTEWIVCANSFEDFLEQYKNYLEKGNLSHESLWPDIIDVLSNLQTVDPAILLHLCHNGQADIARKFAKKSGKVDSLTKIRIEALSAYYGKNYSKALSKLILLKEANIENIDDCQLRLNILEEQNDNDYLQMELNLAIEKYSSFDLYVRRAELMKNLSCTSPHTDNPAKTIEWLSSPVGQQYSAIQLNKAVEDYRMARSIKDDIDIRLEEGQILLDSQRWQEAEHLFSDTLKLLKKQISSQDNNWKIDAAENGLQKAENKTIDDDENFIADIEGIISESQKFNLSPNATRELIEVRDAYHDIKKNEAFDKIKTTDNKKIKQAKKIARQLLNRHIDIPETFKNYDANQLAKKALSFYDKQLSNFVALGFTHMGDIEPLRHTKILGVSVLIRIMLSDDKLTAAIIWRLETDFSSIEAIELESLSENGNILITNNTGSANPFHTPPNIIQYSLSLNASSNKLYEYHRKSIATLNQTFVAFQNINSLYDLMENQRKLKREHSKSQGWVSDTELRGLLGGSYSELAPLVREQLIEMDK